MKYFVNENCIGCGLCTEICPDVFTLTDDGVAIASNEDVDNAAADEAMESCPVNAIEKN